MSSDEDLVVSLSNFQTTNFRAKNRFGLQWRSFLCHPGLVRGTFIFHIVVPIARAEAFVIYHGICEVTVQSGVALYDFARFFG